MSFAMAKDSDQNTTHDVSLVIHCTSHASNLRNIATDKKNRPVVRYVTMSIRLD